MSQAFAATVCFNCLASRVMDASHDLISRPANVPIKLTNYKKRWGRPGLHFSPSLFAGPWGREGRRDVCPKTPNLIPVLPCSGL